MTNRPAGSTTSGPDACDGGDRRDRPVVVFAYPGVQALDVTGPHEVFAGANSALARMRPTAPRYDISIVSATGGPVRTESGLAIGTANATPDRPPAGDVVDELRGDVRPAAPAATLVIPGGDGVLTASDDATTLTAVRDLAGRSDRLVVVCSGTFLAAAAGLVRGRRVTTHWARARRLAARHPDLHVDADPIFVRDGHVWSSAGVTAGIDVSLAVVEDDHGPEIAQVVARWLVMFLRRPGGQSQFAAPVWTERATPGPIRSAQDAVDTDPAGDHRVATLASRVDMSERHFVRRFTAEVGTPPGRYVTAVRVEAARRHLQMTDDTVEVIAGRCGFGSAETLRRAFSSRVGVPPDTYRRRFRTSAPAHPR